MKTEVIEKRAYQSSGQSISYREIYMLDDKLTIKLEIKSDSIDFQSYACAYVFDELKWNLVYSIPYSQMNTKTQLAYFPQYRNNVGAAEKEFKQDAKQLENYVEKILGGK